jgi:predicted ester cyclase
VSGFDESQGPNEDIARRWFAEGWAGNTSLADAIFDDAFTSNGTVVGPTGPTRNVRNRIVGFPDLQIDVNDLVAVGDQVVVRLQWAGTHLGPYGE